MTWQRTWRSVVGGTLLAAVTLHADGAAAQPPATAPVGSPTYAILLKDGNIASVWLDAVGDPAHPVWRCEVPVPRGGEAVRVTTTLTAEAGDWRKALAEAKEYLKGRVADGE